MSLIPLGGFQLPFQKRLSRLYSDTKKSSDFVQEPVQTTEDPEIKALHRKLRIQKDRLVSWGVEWADPNQQSAEIDEALARAGLSAVVGSVMSTVKDILAEAEPLWQNYVNGVAGATTTGGGGSKDRKKVGAWDRRRFEDLVSDLTASIDTLHDLSRTRSTAMMMGSSKAAGASQAKASEEAKVFESTRMETPHQIDPATLTRLHDAGPLDLAFSAGQEIVLMSKQAFADLRSPAGGSSAAVAPQSSWSWSPLLLEFSRFDPIYSSTGIMPPMSRFERLSSGLQRGPQRSPGAWTGLPRLLGYFEDMERSRLGLLYQFPPAFSPVAFDASTRTATGHFVTLRELLARPDYEPRLEAKFRLAYNLANTVFDMHTRGVTHGNLVDGSVAFCCAVPPGGAPYGEPDVRRPLVTSFDLFPDTPSDEPSAPMHPLFHHPLDPYITQLSPLAGKADLRVLDLYSLAMILLSIGMWASVENLVPDPSNASSVPESVLDKLAIRCGTLYMKAVETCWNAVEEELAGRGSGEEVLVGVQAHVTRCLEACCIIDGVSGVAERVRDDEGQTTTRVGEGLLGKAGVGEETASVIPGAFGNEAEEAAMDEALAVLQREAVPMERSAKFLEREAVSTQRAAAVVEERESLNERFRKGLDARNLAYESAQDQGDRQVKRSPGLTVQQAKPAMPQVSRQVARGVRPARLDPASAPPSAQPAAPGDTKTPPPDLQPKARSQPLIEPLPKVTDVTGAEDLKLKERATPRERLRLYPHVEIPKEAIDKWNKVVMPSINMALRSFYRKNPESVELSLEAVGPSPHAVKPTVLVVCTSVGKVKSILSRKMADLVDGSLGFGLKVCRGKVIRSRGDSRAANAAYQERPLNGASIGAWIGYDHLPPVSFGGLVVVDDKPYGMTVHHMLDDPDLAAEDPQHPAMRSAAHEYHYASDDEERWEVSESSAEEEEYACEFEDSDEEELEYSDTELTSDDEEEEDEEEFAEPGDMPGIEPGCGDGYVITQPAFDDVEEGFYPEADSAGDDHVDSCGLGTMYASSGIRRRQEGGLVHEVDWALFEFHDERMPSENVIPSSSSRKSKGKGKGKGGGSKAAAGRLCPTSVAATEELPGLEVRCVARTSGCQTGRIHASLASVRIHGRVSPSHMYQVAGDCSGGDKGKTKSLGVPGDSGAWVVDGGGRVCGHVLAWSQRKRVAYICPMDVLLLDIAEVLGAGEVRLPGGEVVVGGSTATRVDGVGGLVDGVERLGVWDGEGGGGGGGDGGVGISFLSEKVEGKGRCAVVCVEGVGVGG